MRAAIVLAAGSSRRFGRPDKLLAPIGAVPVVLHAVARAREARVARILVVVPALGGRVARLVGARNRCHRIVARRHRDGMAASLAAGLAALKPIEREVLIFLADMPFARAPALPIPAGCDGIRPRVGQAPGHPMLVRASVARGLPLRGDAGLGAGLRRVAFVRGRAGDVLDLDTPAALRRARLGAAKLF